MRIILVLKMKLILKLNLNKTIYLCSKKRFINKFTIDPIYKKSYISLKSSNKFDEDIFIKNYILIYKNEYGDMRL